MSNIIKGTVPTDGTIKGKVQTDISAVIDALVKKVIAQANKITTVTLYADKWVGDNNQYSQVVAIDGATANSQVDLTPSAEQLSIFYEKDITFVTKNVGGVVTVYAIGQKLQNDYTIQVTITEVAYE